MRCWWHQWTKWTILSPGVWMQLMRQCEKCGMVQTKIV